MRPHTVILLSVAFLSFPVLVHGQKAIDTLESAEPGYKAGCAWRMDQAGSYCNQVCGELWSEKQKADRRSRCEQEKKRDAEQMVWKCKNDAYQRNSFRMQACYKQSYQNAREIGNCVTQSNKQMEREVAQCK